MYQFPLYREDVGARPFKSLSLNGERDLRYEASPLFLQQFGDDRSIKPVLLHLSRNTTDNGVSQDILGSSIITP